LKNKILFFVFVFVFLDLDAFGLAPHTHTRTPRTLKSFLHDVIRILF
jgi:hypothetical protein